MKRSFLLLSPRVPSNLNVVGCRSYSVAINVNYNYPTYGHAKGKHELIVTKIEILDTSIFKEVKFYEKNHHAIPKMTSNYIMLNDVITFNGKAGVLVLDLSSVNKSKLHIIHCCVTSSPNIGIINTIKFNNVQTRTGRQQYGAMHVQPLDHFENINLSGGISGVDHQNIWKALEAFSQNSIDTCTLLESQEVRVLSDVVDVKLLSKSKLPITDSFVVNNMILEYFLEMVEQDLLDGTLELDKLDYILQSTALSTFVMSCDVKPISRHTENTTLKSWKEEAIDILQKPFDGSSE